MTFRKVVCLLLLALAVVALPVAEQLFSVEEPALRTDGGQPPPPIPGHASQGLAA